MDNWKFMEYLVKYLVKSLGYTPERKKMAEAR